MLNFQVYHKYIQGDLHKFILLEVSTINLKIKILNFGITEVA